MTLEIRGINFAFDRYNIDEKSEKILTEALTYINTLPPQQQIEVNGWTDWVGSDAYNAVLSQNRANAVKDWFIAHGIEASRLMAIGRGKSFKYNNRTSYGRYLNRHMELRFIPLDD